MKTGQKHNWKYINYSEKETPINKYKTRILYIQGKNRRNPAPYGSGMQTGSKLVWGINGTFTTRKTRNGWKTLIQGYKHQKKVKPKGRPWH